MNKAIEVLDQIIPVLSAAGVTNFKNGLSVSAEDTVIGDGLGNKESVPLGIDSFPKLLDTKFFENVHTIIPLTSEQRFRDGVEIVSVQMGPDVYLNSTVKLYSISVLPHFFYQYSQNAVPGVEVLPSFVSENKMRPTKRIMVTIDLEEAQDALAKIVGDEFQDNLPGLEMELNDIKEKKFKMISLQNYDEAAKLRDKEKHVLSLIDAAKQKKAEPVAAKLERVKARTTGSFIETISREFSDKLSKIIVDPNYTDVEEYSPIILRMTPDSFTHAKTRLDQEIQDYKLNYLAPKSYLNQHSS